MLLCLNILYCWAGMDITLGGKERKPSSIPWAHAGADTVSNMQLASLAHLSVLCFDHRKGREMP